MVIYKWTAKQNGYIQNYEIELIYEIEFNLFLICYFLLDIIYIVREIGVPFMTSRIRILPFQTDQINF